MGAVVKKSFCRHHTGRGGKGLRMGAILDGKKRLRLAGILRRSGDGPRTGLVHSIAHVFTEREPGGRIFFYSACRVQISGVLMKPEVWSGFEYSS